MFTAEAEMKYIKFNLQFQIGMEEKVDIDKELLMDVLVNIISNSIKFT